jgi:FkbM family methyltransferase
MFLDRAFKEWLATKIGECKSANGDKSGGEFRRVGSMINHRLEQGMSLSTVIDVGASDSRWSAELIKIVPDANYLLIEANKVHEEKLKEFKNQYANVDYVLAAASDKKGTVFFEIDDEDPFGGVASHKKTRENFTAFPAVTVDDCVKEKKLDGPYLLKLDIHGFEVPILEGAKNTLKKTVLIVVEVYNFRIETYSLLFHEMCEYLSSKGFRCIGIAEEMYRPKDNILWQFDGVFIPSNSPEFSDNAYG